MNKREDITTAVHTITATHRIPMQQVPGTGTLSALYTPLVRVYVDETKT